jgi:large subunit ribosomal protein L10
MLKRAEKEQKVEELTRVFAEAPGIYLADYTRLNVETMTELRRICREAGIRFEVIKNSLGRFAAEKADIPGLPEHLVGPNAMVISGSDNVAPARLLSRFAKEHEGPRLKVAYVEGRIFTGEEIAILANLPPRDVLLGNLLRALQGTLTQFVTVLKAPVRDLGNVLNQLTKSKESAED